MHPWLNYLRPKVAILITCALAWFAIISLAPVSVGATQEADAVILDTPGIPLAWILGH